MSRVHEIWHCLLWKALGKSLPYEHRESFTWTNNEEVWHNSSPVISPHRYIFLALTRANQKPQLSRSDHQAAVHKARQRLLSHSCMSAADIINCLFRWGCLIASNSEPSKTKKVKISRIQGWGQKQTMCHKGQGIDIRTLAKTLLFFIFWFTAICMQGNILFHTNHIYYTQLSKTPFLNVSCSSGFFPPSKKYKPKACVFGTICCVVTLHWLPRLCKAPNKKSLGLC